MGLFCSNTPSKQTILAEWFQLSLRGQKNSCPSPSLGKHPIFLLRNYGNYENYCAKVVQSMEVCSKLNPHEPCQLRNLSESILTAVEYGRNASSQTQLTFINPVDVKTTLFN